MQQVLRILVAAFAVVALASMGGIVSAQTQVPFKQIKLSEKHLESFISSHKDMAELLEKLPAETSESAAQREIDAVAKKHGFKDHNEYNEVAANIDLVMSCIDPKTREFTEPPVLLKKELDDVMADKSMPEQDRKQWVDELTERVKTAQPILHRSNVDLILKYYDKLEPLQQ
jgi:type I restriction-modification system DNA methylase subunit